MEVFTGLKETPHGYRLKQRFEKKADSDGSQKLTKKPAGSDSQVALAAKDMLPEANS